MSRKQLGLGAFVAILVGVLALGATAVWAQSIDEIAAKGVKAAVVHPTETCFANVCGATNGIVNPVGFGGPTAIAWTGVDPVYSKFTGYAKWEGKHQCPARNGGPWKEQEMVSDVWLMYSDHIDPVHGACRLEVLSDPDAYNNTTGEVMCQNYKEINGQVLIADCNAIVHMDPLQKESDPLSCPGWIQSLDNTGGLHISWQMVGLLSTANQQLSWKPYTGSPDIHGDNPAVVQLR